MPDSTTEIKAPATEAGRRLLASAWSLGPGEPFMVDTIAAIEAEAAAAERAAIKAAVLAYHRKRTKEMTPTAEAVVSAVLDFLDARQP